MTSFVDNLPSDSLYMTLSYIRWDKFIVRPALTIKEIYNLSIKNKYFSYFYCLRFRYKKRQIEKEILKLKDPKFAFLFYRDIDCNKNAMKKILLKGGKYLVKFASEINNLYLKKAESYIYKSKDYQSALMLLRNYKYLNEQKLINIVIKNSKPKHLLGLAKLYKKNKNIINKIQDKLIEYGNFKYLTYLTMNHNYNLNKIENFIRASGTVEDALFFANKVKNSNLRKLLIFA